MNNPDPQQPARPSEDTLMLVLCYFGILSLIPFFTRKTDPYVYWHAKQGVTLCAVSIVAWIPLVILGFIPFVGWIIGLLGLPCLGLGILAVSILGIVKAVGGQQWKIPLVGDLAQKW